MPYGTQNIPFADQLGADPDPFLTGAQRIYDALASRYTVGSGGRRVSEDPFQWEEYRDSTLRPNQQADLFRQAMLMAMEREKAQSPIEAARVAREDRPSPEQQFLIAAAAERTKAGESPATSLAWLREQERQFQGPTATAGQAAAPAAQGFIDPNVLATLGTINPKTGAVEARPTGSQLASFVGQLPENLAPEAGASLADRIAKVYGGEDVFRNVQESRLDDILRTLQEERIGPYTRTSESPGSPRSVLTGPYRSVTYERQPLHFTWPKAFRSTGNIQELRQEGEAIARLLDILSRRGQR